MADETPDMNTLLNTLADQVNKLDIVLLGNETDTITAGGVTKPSITKAINDRFKRYITVSAQQPSGVPKDGEEWIVV